MTFTNDNHFSFGKYGTRLKIVKMLNTSLVFWRNNSKVVAKQIVRLDY